MQHTSKARRDINQISIMERMRDVGPLSYSPVNPSLKRSDNLHGNSIGNGLRSDFVPRMKVPAPNNYKIMGQFEKAAS